jgi:hypothetical protein
MIRVPAAAGTVCSPCKDRCERKSTQESKTDEHKHGDGETEPRLWDHATDDPTNLRDDDDNAEVNSD